MKQEKNNKEFLIYLVIMISVFVTLYYSKNMIFNNSTKNNNNNTNNIEQEENKIYEIDEYITLEDVDITSKVKIKKVKINNLSDELTKEFYKEQDKIINEIIENSKTSNEEIFNAKEIIKYSINDNILSIIYKVEETNEIGTCALTEAVTNIDLKNNKIVTEEELLNKAKTSYKDLVNKYYEEEDKKWQTLKDNNGKIMDYYEVTYSDFKNNKEKYITEGLEKIPDVIYTYIEDGKIKYDYYIITIDTLFHQVGKGGCFAWKTEELGKY